VSTRSLILDYLKKNAGQTSVSGKILAGRFSVTRAAIHKQIRGLRQAGYSIVGKSRCGYRFEASENILDVRQIRSALSAERFYGHLEYHPVLSSTQDVAKDRAFHGEPEGTVVIAERQTSGRGRLGRRWISSPGGLWFSIILRPALSPRSIPSLPLVAALVLCRTIEEVVSLKAGLKWPNDVWIRGKKVAGILAEMSSESDRVQWVVLGLGLNCLNSVPSDVISPAGSLADLTGSRSVPRQEILTKFLGEFRKAYQRYLMEGFAAFRADYRRRSVLIGRDVTVNTSTGKRRGRVVDVDGEGRLVLRLSPGRNIVLSEGDVVPGSLRQEGRGRDGD